MRYFAMAVLACLCSVAPAFAAEEVDVEGGPVSYAPPEAGPVWTPPAASAVLYNNGPLITGPCGADSESRLQSQTMGMTILGFGHQAPPEAPGTGNRVADNFTVPAGACWDITTITFFGYETNAGTGAPTMTAVNYQIWNGRPGDGGSLVIFGDTATNRLLSSTWARIYRTTETTSCATSRPVFANVCAAGTQLNAGTYWLDWQTAGGALAGPWAPPVTVIGVCTTGNGRQSINGAWGDARDGGAQMCQQDFPFVIEGTQCSTPVAASTWGAIKAVYH